MNDMTVSTGRNSVADVAYRVLEPLSPETAKFLKPHRFEPSDRLWIGLRGDHFHVQAYALVNDQRVQASFQARYTWATKVPEHRDLGNNRWELGATDLTAVVINANWSIDKIEWEDDDARNAYEFLLFRFLNQTVAAQRRALFKIRGQLPPLPDDWHDHPDRPLTPYQVAAVVPFIGQEGACFFQEQGTGKTPEFIRLMCIEARRHTEVERVAAESEKRKRRLFRVLIVCPKNVRNNWQRELAAFATIPGKTVVLRGGALNRMKLMLEAISSDDESEFAAVICSYEAVERSWDVFKMIQWSKCVLDESHYIKSNSAQRQKRMLILRDLCDSRVCMSGTPVTNKLFDLYGQLEFLGQGMSGFTSYYKFREFYGQFKKIAINRGRYIALTGYQNLPFIQERLARCSFMISKKEALPYLPAKLYDVIEVEMTPTQLDWYRKMQERLIVEIEGSEKKLTAQHILVKLLRLAQITSGFVKWDAKYDLDTGEMLEAGEVEEIEPNPKIEALMELIEKTSDDEKVIVWACFRPDIKRISEALTARGILHGCFTGSTKDEDRVALEDAFNGRPATEMKVFVGNAAAGGTGLNLRGYLPSRAAPVPDLGFVESAVRRHCGRRVVLSKGVRRKWYANRYAERFAAWRVRNGEEPDHGCDCTHVVYYSQNWSMVYRNQSEDRAHRLGTRRPVQYTDIVVPGTIDEEIRHRVTAKTVSAMNVQDVRDVMKRILETLTKDDED